MSTREQRGYQMFPVLDGARVETALRFASGPGQFTGEVNQFADRETGFYLPGIVMVNI
jgi:hypothetical protein